MLLGLYSPKQGIMTKIFYSILKTLHLGAGTINESQFFKPKYGNIYTLTLSDQEVLMFTKIRFKWRCNDILNNMSQFDTTHCTCDHSQCTSDIRSILLWWVCCTIRELLQKLLSNQRRINYQEDLACLLILCHLHLMIDRPHFAHTPNRLSVLCHVSWVWRSILLNRVKGHFFPLSPYQIFELETIPLFAACSSNTTCMWQ